MARLREINLREFAKKVALFSAGNYVGTLVDTAVLWLFSTFVFHSYVGKYVISPFISFECAVLFNFINNFFIVWRNRTPEKNRMIFIKKYITYNISCFGAFGLKMVVLLIVERIFSLHVVICNLIALCFSGVFNFFMAEFVVFKKKEGQDNRF